ncbi:MAG: DNA mismatch endonuclease Vsr [Candidatus Thiodiazotropha taylori]|nr:DNA mismatch endonuclease Vsr [Candidatus Thiodiazotropha taylori]
MMRAVPKKDTTPELIVRRCAHRLGLRFRLHRKDLPGTPDIVFPKYRTVIFVHGCFWHRHNNCRFATMPSSRITFWQSKFDANVKRDLSNVEALERRGWIVHVIWECETKDTVNLKKKLLSIFQT